MLTKHNCIRCDDCGEFISHSDIQIGIATHKPIQNSLDYYSQCASCLIKARKVQALRPSAYEKS